MTPVPVLVQFGGDDLELLPVVARESEHVGYGFQCGGCGVWMLIGAKTGHVLLHGSRGLTVRPGVECPRGCGWRVTIELGRAQELKD